MDSFKDKVTIVGVGETANTRPEQGVGAVHLFLEAAKSTPYYALFYLALFTGMRRSELLALRWSDVDLTLCQLSVTRTIHQLHNGNIIFQQTKTDKSRRMVSLSPSTAIVLIEHRELQEKMRQSLGLTLADEGLVFCQIDGKPLLPDSITHTWMKLARRTGLKSIRLHDARHTHASLMLKQGIHPKIVQERLGHSSIQITLDTYSHVAPGLQQAAANRFDDIVLPKPTAEANKEAVVRGEDACTVSIPKDIMLARDLRNLFTQKYLEMREAGASSSELNEFLNKHSQYHAQAQGDAEGSEICCGQGAGLITGVESATQVIEDIVSRVESCLDELKRKLTNFS